MSPPARDPSPRARELRHWLTGLLLLGLLAAGLVTAGYLLWERVDVNRLVRGEGAAPAPPEEPLPAPDALASVRPARPPGASFRAVLLESPESASRVGGDSVQEALRDAWRELAGEAGGVLGSVRDAGGLDALEPSATVLVPAAPCMDFDLALALERHLRKGGSLVLSGAVGTRDAACAWRGWEVLLALTGADGAMQLERRTGVPVTVPAGLPLSPGLDPGTRIEFRYDYQVALRQTGPRAYWSDWSLSPRPALPVAGRGPAGGLGAAGAAAGGEGEGGAGAAGNPGGGGIAGALRSGEAGPEGGSGAAAPAHDAAALARETGRGGRAVWFAFRPGEAATARDSLLARRLFLNGLLWAARVPVAQVASWPSRRRAVLIVSQDVESRPENARVLADVLRERDLRGTFFVVSGLVEEEERPEALASRLAAVGEIGSHTADHRVLAGAPAADQRIRLVEARRRTAAWSGRDVAGLRPPEERYDRATLEAWAAAGGSYLAAVTDGRSAAPELHRTGRGEVVVLPRIVVSDYDVLARRGLRGEEATALLARSCQKAERLGGLALLSFHSQFTGLDRRAFLASTLDSALARGDWWLTTGAGAAAWWRARSLARVELARVGGGALSDGADRDPRGAAGRGARAGASAGTGAASEAGSSVPTEVVSTDGAPTDGAPTDGVLEIRVEAAEGAPLPPESWVELYPGWSSGAWTAERDGEPRAVARAGHALLVELGAVPAGGTAVVRVVRDASDAAR